MLQHDPTLHVEDTQPVAALWCIGEVDIQCRSCGVGMDVQGTAFFVGPDPYGSASPGFGGTDIDGGDAVPERT